MKKILLFAPILFILVSCGPSQKEKEEIAIVTCNIMGESRIMDASIRIKEINAARDQIGEAKYLSTDKEIKEALEYGLCKELVLNDPSYPSKLSELKRLEIEAIRKAEEKAEADRIAEEAKRKEAIRKAEEKAEADRIAEEAKRKEVQKQLRSAIVDSVNEMQLNPTITEISYNQGYSSNSERLTIRHTCDTQLDGLQRRIRIIFKDNLGTLEETFPKIKCYSPGEQGWFFRSWHLDDVKGLRNKRISEALIDEIYLDIIGIDDEEPPKDPRFDAPLSYNEKNKRFLWDSSRQGPYVSIRLK